MGPLRGLKIIELAGIGPCPMCAMLLAELGADVVRVDRLTDSGLGIDMAPEHQLLNRSRPSIAIDLKHPGGTATVLRLVERADALIAGGAVDGGDPLCVLGDVGAQLPIHRREKDAGDPGFTLATAVFRIAGTHVCCEVFDDLLHPPAYRGRMQPPGTPHLSGPVTASAPACPPRGGSDPSIRRP